MFTNYQVGLIVLSIKQYKKECRKNARMLAMCQLQMIQLYQPDLGIFQEKEVIDILEEYNQVPISAID